MDKYNKNKPSKKNSLSKSTKYTEILENMLNEESDNEYICDTKSNELLNVLLSEDEELEQKMFLQQQLRDKLEFNQNIIEERNEEIQQIYKDVLDINEIFKDLNQLVISQAEPINQLENQIDETVKNTENGITNLQKANEYHKSWFSRRNKLILMSIAGLSVNVPITILFGLKAGAISGLSTIGLSAITSLFSKK
jgi:hypothetical protein